LFVPRFDDLIDSFFPRFTQDNLTTLIVGMGPFMVPEEKLFLSSCQILVSFVRDVQQGSKAAVEIERCLEILKGKSNKLARSVQSFEGQHQGKLTAAVVWKLERGPTL
jgi:hypothetical protein